MRVKLRIWLKKQIGLNRVKRLEQHSRGHIAQCFASVLLLLHIGNTNWYDVLLDTHSCRQMALLTISTFSFFIVSVFW